MAQLGLVLAVAQVRPLKVQAPLCLMVGRLWSQSQQVEHNWLWAVFC
jgi:hypothetical protein